MLSVLSGISPPVEGRWCPGAGGGLAPLQQRLNQPQSKKNHPRHFYQSWHSNNNCVLWGCMVNSRIRSGYSLQYLPNPIPASYRHLLYVSIIFKLETSFISIEHQEPSAEVFRKKFLCQPSIMFFSRFCVENFQDFLLFFFFWGGGGWGIFGVGTLPLCIVFHHIYGQFQDNNVLGIF